MNVSPDTVKNYRETIETYENLESKNPGSYLLDLAATHFSYGKILGQIDKEKSNFQFGQAYEYARKFVDTYKCSVMGAITQDTHGIASKGWYGFDLDGTLATYDHWRGIDHIGAPVAPMVHLMRRLHDEGKTVKIVTARVAPRKQIETKPNPWFEQRLTIDNPGKTPWRIEAERYTALEYIKDWCVSWLGFVPEITYQKDHLMMWLVDDRTVQIEKNTGRIIGMLPDEMKF